MGCRFPGGANNPDDLWRLLHDGGDAIREVPRERWDLDAYYDPKPGTPGKTYSRWGGFLERVDLFDAGFFGISPREALSMDPQQRLVLEVSWEALEHAGQSPEALAGSQTGVFLGISTNEYAHLMRSPRAIDVYTPTGNALSVAAGRVSYILGLHGPSLAVDTACSASLAAIHLAFQSLRSRECSMALAGGVNLLLSPMSMIGISELRMLAPDGRCKTFDSAADGFVRAEGCGIVVLKRLSDAASNGDRILALIRGSAVNQDGRSGGLTAPNGPAQEAVIRRALESGQVSPSEVQYVEAHGTGTSLGDPIEVRALAAVLSEGRKRDDPVAIGSVKTNLGHLEAAAGVAGLIKTVLALHHEEIPPHLHLKNLTPHVAWDDIPVVVPTAPTPWPTGGKRRIAGVSSFGFSGTNAHVILEEAPAVETVAQVEQPPPLQLLTLSAKSDAALRQLAERYQQHLTSDGSASFADICFTANAGRAHFSHRLALLADSAGEAAMKLAALVRGDEPSSDCFSGVAERGQEPQLAFLFTGQGSQYVGMGRRLYETQPHFRKLLHDCEQMLEGQLQRPLLSVLYADDDTVLHETAYTQPALFALEYALAELWRSWGIVPQVVAGHSLGEYVAACVAGIFSLPDGLRLVAERGRLMQTLPSRGAMAAVYAAEREVRSRLAGQEESLSVAALNGPENTVISGAEVALEQVLQDLEAAGIGSQRLRVSHGFHSPAMAAIQAEFAAAAAQVSYGKAQIGIVSNLTGRLAEAGEMERADYWVRQLRQPVRFRQTMETLREQGCGIYLEIGPKPTLLGLGQQCLGADAAVWLNSLRPGRDDWQEMLRSVGQLYRHGVEIAWQGFYGDSSRRVSLPTYPFQRKRYWFEAAAVGEPEPAGPAFGHADAILESAEVWKQWLYESRWEAKPRAFDPLAADFVPATGEIAAALAPYRIALNSDHHLDLYAEVIPQLDRLAAAYIAEAIAKLGWQWTLHRRVPADTVAESLGVVAAHRRLLARLFEILVDEAYLRKVGGEFEIIRSPATSPGAETSSRLMAEYPQMRAEVSLLERAGQHLAGVLSGQTNPIEVLFPGGSISTLEALYQDSPAARACSCLVRQAVAEAVRRLPQGRTVRVLEVGAGTGGTTSFVLPELPPQATQYVFTDLSPQFTANAALKFRAYPFLRRAILDIECDPASQGFQSHTFDLVLAVNVLHATADLRQTLAHVKQLLAPKGLLLMLEVAGPQRWLDLVFGITEGWWRFAEGNLRPSNPFLAPDQWVALLQHSGFSHCVSLPHAEDPRSELAEPALILAQAPALETTPAVGDSLPGKWLLFADQGGVAEELAAAMRKRGADAVLVYPGGSYARSDGASRRLDPANRQEFQLLLQDPHGENSSPWRGVVHLWGLDNADSEELTVGALEEAQVTGCGSAIHLTQAMAACQHGNSPRLWLVTRGAQHTGTESEPPALAQAPLWGLGRVVALEHPELWGGMIDLTADASTAADAAHLIDEISNPDGEDQIAWRGDGRYVARLFRTQTPSDSATAPKFSPESTYLVTGGFGDLGLKVADWLVQGGARHLVLLGRTGLPERSSWHTSPAKHHLEATIAAVEALERAGAAVHLPRADVGDLSQMRAVLEQIRTQGPPLRGIVHAAAEITATTVQAMDLDGLGRGLRAKVSGTWVLHQLTRQMDLDFFVLFSSTTSLLGSRYLAHYAAANQFIDMFAHFRKSLGLPALAVDWGMWDREKKDSSLGGPSLRQMGLRAMPSADALAALGHLLGTGAAQMAVADIDWSTLKPYYEARRRRPYLEKIEVGARKVQAEAVDQELLNRVELASATQRQKLLVDYLQRQVGKVLGFDANSAPDAQEGFFELGMDSLTSVELKNRLETALGRSFPTTVVLEYPNIEALAGYIATELFGAGDTPVPVAEPQPDEDPTQAQAENFDQLSREKLLSLMAHELAAIEERKKS